MSEARLLTMVITVVIFINFMLSATKIKIRLVKHIRERTLSFYPGV